MGDTLTVTYRFLMYSNNFWQKLVHTPAATDKSGYWIHRMRKKVEAVQKTVGKEMITWSEALAEKYGQKDPAGKVMIGGNGLPAPRPECRTEYEDEFEAFMNKTTTVDFHRLPLEYFSHISKTPADWEALEQITDVTPESLEKASKKTSGLAAVQ